MIQKVHNFEIAQIHQDSYVQYLHLLSQITVNTQELGDQPSPEGFTGNTEFLVQNIHQFCEKCIQEDQRKKLLNSKEHGQKNMIYQFFFINYLLSICIVDVVRSAQNNQGLAQKKKGDKFSAMESQRSISQKIFIILIKLLEALSDNELNSTVDQLITNRIQTFQELNGGSKTQPVEEESKTEENPVEINRNSVTLTITKMILFNMDKLLQVSLEVQKQYLQEINFQSKKETADLLAHKM